MQVSVLAPGSAYGVLIYANAKYNKYKISRRGKKKKEKKDKRTSTFPRFHGRNSRVITKLRYFEERAALSDAIPSRSIISQGGGIRFRRRQRNTIVTLVANITGITFRFRSFLVSPVRRRSRGNGRSGTRVTNRPESGKGPMTPLFYSEKKKNSISRNRISI